MNSVPHTSVLLEESVENLITKSKNKGRTYVDATLGIGGHSERILERLDEGDILIGIDRDAENLERAKARLKDAIVASKATMVFVHDSFAHLHSILRERNVDQIDGILYDLGVSSVHYDEAERGFSTRFDGPLDMRFDRTSTGPTAADILATYDERELFRIFRDYADEPKAIFIARAIVEARKSQKFETTAQLKALIEKASFDPKSPIRVFQALRIEANRELEAVEDSLHAAVESLAPGGRICVITFHSIEDRLVKNLFKAYETPKTNDLTGAIMEPAILRKVHKKPIEPSPEEQNANSRSRSSKLRVLEKI